MTQKEYKALIKASPVFKTLDDDLKESVLNATGQLRESYVEIFLDAAKVLRTATEEFVKRNDEIVKEFKEEVKEINKEGLNALEKESDREDAEKQDKLLNELNNI